jgi:curved DNA-binding protein CbpA
MTDDKPVDYYEVLQLSASAEPDTIHRVFRLLAQRFHPDNTETGSEARFREIQEAYSVLSDPEKRARYDIVHQQKRQDRWRLVTTGAHAENDFEIEQMVRLTLLEALYTQRRVDPGSAAIYSTDLENLLGRAREHLEFTIWYLNQRKLVTRSDNSSLIITADGADFLESHYSAHLHRKRLTAAPPSATAEYTRA